MKSAIPIIFGVTGHRDLKTEDVDKLKEIVRGIFQEYKQNYSATPLMLLSALAEGADMLVAEVALDEGVELVAVLPYTKEEYLKSFDDPTQVKRFESLLKKATHQEILQEKKDGGYIKLAEFLAKNSNILLALWDGDTSDIKDGGTADVVMRKKHGYKVENLLDTNEEDMILHIKTPRVKNPDIEEALTINPITIGRVEDEKYQKILTHIDNLNITLEQNQIFLDKLQSFFSKRANFFQNRYEVFSLVMVILAFLAVFSMEVVHNFGAEHPKIEYIFTICYFGIVSFIFAFFYIKLKDANLKNHFVHSRGLSEALRVQDFWFCIDDEPQRVGDYYLLGELSELAWIRAVLKNIYFLKSLKQKNHIDFECVKKDWINGQITYYQKAIKTRKNKLELLEKVEKLFYFLGLSLAVLLFIKYAIHHFKHLEHSILFASGISFAIAAFVGEKYLPMKGYKDEIHNFELMLHNFQVALEMLEKTQDTKEQKQIIYDLGEKALQENSKWLVYHSKYKIKPIVE